LKKTDETLKIAYLHGRPAAHPLHQRLANAIGSDFYFADAALQWQDKNYPGFLLPVIWALCGLFQKKVKYYDIFLVDNLHVSAAFLKILRLNKRKQKVVVHLASHTLYFMKIKRYSRFNLIIQKWALKQFDGVICEGYMAMDYVNEILSGNTLKLYYSFNGLSAERALELDSIKPNLNTKQILTITQIEGADFRLWYKGIDIMLEAFDKALVRDPELRFIIVGTFDKKVLDKYLLKFPKQTVDKIEFVGYSKNLLHYYSTASLYLHTARGDAFPTTTIESMRAGLPVIISDQTGTKEIVKSLGESLISTLNTDDIADKIMNYFALDAGQKIHLSDNCRKAVAPYTQESSIRNYKDIIRRVSLDIVEK
jgi:glycosyltransferase involved in cell wall biosynthesis